MFKTGNPIFHKYAVISENNEIENSFIRRDSFLDICLSLNSSAACKMQPPKPVIFSEIIVTHSETTFSAFCSGRVVMTNSILHFISFWFTEHR